MTQATCEFVFDPADWEAAHDTRCSLEDDLLEDGHWRCHRDVANEAAYCVFHRPPTEKDPETVAEAFRRAVRNEETPQSSDEDARSRRFIGARFDELPLSYTNLGAGSNHPIDLRYATIEGSLDLEHATVAAHLLAEGSQIGEITAHGCTFEQRVDVSASTIDTVDFQSTTFRDRVNCRGIELGRGKLFNATFEGRALFRGATVRETFSARRACFEADASFSKSTFERRASFVATTFHGDASFTDIDVEASLSFADVRATSAFQLDPARVAADVQRIDLTESHLDDGYLRYPPESDAVLDVSHATLGTVTIGSGPSTVDFQRYRFIETAFEGFEFSTYTDALVGRNWLIHPLPSADEHVLERSLRIPLLGRLRRGLRTIRAELLTETEFPPGELRSTYLKAKNGAQEVGDDSAAAEFFVHEMRYKRKSYARAVTEHHSGWALFQWLSNWGYSVTAGYGERPFRTFLASSGFIGVFALGYMSLAPLSVDAALAFSFQAFVALVLGEPAGASRFPLLAAFEAFVGAFMIALFVFTLTRSINR